MVLPILVVLVTPVLVGRFLGADILAGLVLGVIITGVPLAIFMVITGSAWDNTKKYLEGKSGDKGAINSAIIGDTVGDPLKDTAGPSISVLIKLVAIIALVLALVI
jgi:K(+)-stimulated pyrophosphate-energized sodium pump